MNTWLSAQFMEWEVKEAIKQMALLKALGPDGMPPLFFQNYWNLIGDDVTQDVLNFLNPTTLPPPPPTSITPSSPLSLKQKVQKNVSEYKPISLCNVHYKIFSKVLVNRVKKVL